MLSFYKVLENNIKTTYTTHDREYFETIIATWLLKGYLTTDEVDQLLALLDTLYGPVTQPIV